MIIKTLIIVAACFLFHLISAQIVLDQPCPSFDCCKTPVNVSENVDLDGIWYLNQGVFFFFDQNKRCQTINITLLPDLYLYGNVSRIDLSTEQQSSYFVFGNFSLDSEFIDLQFTDLKFPLTAELIELTTTYKILTFCSDCGFFSKEGAGLYVYVYTRSRRPAPPVLESIANKLKQCGLPADQIGLHNQTNCMVPVGC